MHICFTNILSFENVNKHTPIANITAMFLISILISGFTVNGAVIFTKSDSPYKIETDLMITNGDSIIIEPGSILIISPDVHIITNGVVLINGSYDEQVSILPEVEGIGWGKIDINCHNKTSLINNANIIDGSVHSRNCDMQLDNVTFINNQTLPWNNPILFIIDASANIKNSSIYGSHTGEGFQMLNSENVLVKNCFFSKIPDAVELTNITGGYISHNRFENILDDAIDLNNCTNTIIDSNIIINAADRGIELGSENNGNSENIIVKRNVLIGCKVGIILKEESYGHIINNTFYGNNIGVKCIEDNGTKVGSFMNVQNCIFSNSVESDAVHDLNSTIVTNYCLSNKEALVGTSNIFDDPCFKNSSDDDFSLMAKSPCIDAGNPELPVDPDGSISDIGAYYFNTDTTGIYDLKNKLPLVKIFPNPFIDYFTVSSENKDQLKVKLYTISGSIIPILVEERINTKGYAVKITPTCSLKSNTIICEISSKTSSKTFLIIHK